MHVKRSVVWFRQDLRVHDNEALTEALRHTEEVIPVFVFDERVFQGKTRYGFPKTGKFRAQFIIEAVLDLQQTLRDLGSDLIIRVGKPEDEIFQIAREVKSSWVFCNRERTQEELEVQDKLEKRLWSVGQEVRYSRGKMLYYTADLPFPVTHTPDVFTHFKKEVERFIPIRKPLPVPEALTPMTKDVKSHPMPTIADFGHEAIVEDERSALAFKGGETEALRRLHYYLWESDLIKKYKETRNELIGGDYSSKFSPWLAQGCLSPKMIYSEVMRYEQERTKNKSTYWLVFELMWRDFFRLMGKKHENHIFKKGGTKHEINSDLKDNENLLNLWIQGRTGVPFIDANMRELALTGFMSNRGRQNVASFLVHDLHVNWQMGAAYFESALLDYDPCSNYGNWNYVAGVGSDPRENRYFNILRQANRYDSEGAYVKHWLPELAQIPASKVHQPDQLSETEQIEWNVKLGADYPRAMISTEKWV